MPRVLRILNRLIIGGPAINATYLSRFMAPEYETLLVIGGKDDHEQDATHITERLGIETVTVPEMKRAINWSNDRTAYKKVKQLIKDFKPDIVHTHAAKSGAIGRLAARACKVPVIVHTFHGHVFHSYFGTAKTKAFIRIEQFLAARSSGIIAISDIQKRELSETYKICPAEKIKVIPLGLDLDRFTVNEEEKRKQFRLRYGIKDDEVAIGIIGRIVPVKNHSLFVKAAAALLKRSAQKLKFIVVGDGDMRPQMEQEFKDQNISYAYWPQNQDTNVTAICTSWLTEIDEVLLGMDIVALTSNNEGTPLSMIEAQSAARAVVSTNVGGVTDIIKNGETGYVVPPQSADALADALLMLTEDKARRDQFGLAGRQFVRSHFSYQRLVRDMDQYYKELLSAAGR